jgi:alkyl sulfatase BDS1-like metallo-beta-lactamase superfamily hydrolase
MLSDFSLGHITSEGIQGPDVMFEGDKTVLSSLADLLDMFPAWFPIATHDLKYGEANL